MRLHDLAACLCTELCGQLYPFARKLIDRFGDRADVLKSLALNMGSIGGWGSLTPRYQARISALSELEHHQLEPVRKW